ncbi:MAG TPA: nucleotidyltransferase [Segetibacter sp.]|jgi:predicted nucleotidyltransferase
MDIFDKEVIKFWKCLSDSNVRYIMIGGYATNLNGYQRYTGDMDLWIEDSIENRKNLRTAFRNCEMGDYFMLETMQIVPGWTNFNLNNGLKLDLLLDVKGLEDFTFEECLGQANKADIDDITVPFLHINHLIASKKAANRPKDQIDVIYLEKIKQLLKDQGKS